MGPAVRPMYVEFIHLANKAIRDLGYGDYGQWERRSFDTDTLPRDVEKILNGLMPMYRNLHAYARKKLMAVYGADKFPKTRHIPAHLLGNVSRIVSVTFQYHDPHFNPSLYYTPHK